MRRVVILFAAVAALSGGSALADEIIYFSNGSAMPIQSHQLREDVIHVVLGPNASMAFPRHLVERIERGGVAVFPSATLRGVNQVSSGIGVVSRSNEIAYPQDGSAGVPARFRSKSSRRRQMMDPAEQLVQAGTSASEGTVAPGRAGRLGVRIMNPAASGNQNTGPAGTYPLGDKHVIGSTQGPSARRPNIIGITIKPGYGAEPAPPPPAAEEQGAVPVESQGADASGEAPPESE